MSYYTFAFKRDDIELQLTSTDKYEIEKQMKIWVNCVSVYQKSRKNIQETLVENLPKPQIAESRSEIKKPVIEKKEVEEVKQPETVETEPVPVETNQETLPSAVNEEQKQKTNDEQTINNMNIPKPQKNFTELLEQQIESGTYEPKFRHDNKFIDFVNSVNIEDAEIRFGLLLKASYYLSKYENYDRITLKDINAKLMQNFSIIVDHSIVEKAISQGFLEVVPDLTGTSDAAEYRLTELSEKIFA